MTIPSQTKLDDLSLCALCDPFSRFVEDLQTEVLEVEISFALFSVDTPTHTYIHTHTQCNLIVSRDRHIYASYACPEVVIYDYCGFWKGLIALYLNTRRVGGEESFEILNIQLFTLH